MSNIVLRLAAKPAPPGRLWADLWLPVLGFSSRAPQQAAMPSRCARAIRRSQSLTLYLATFTQRKMELNVSCSPDLSNDRRQNDVAGNRKINNDGVGLTPSIGQMLLLFKGSAASCCCPRDSLARIQRSLSLTLYSIFSIFANSCDLVELTGIEPVTSCLQSRRSPN